MRLGIAALLGGLLGLERERSGKSAGVLTHMLVAMGSALFLLVSQQSGIARADIGRVVQGLVAGIGFLGAGAILKHSEDHRVQGLTTAAGIWLTAAIGMAAGLGQEMTALLSTLLALLVLSLEPVVGRLARRQHTPVATVDQPASPGTPG
ncbi:MgtC/SapB family protein [Xylophilus sp.]|uniref:MgtC/SapB family protein n=1 Tax=Xylophilus sp. TaxID=2653893 RepID=UPI0013B8EBC9|nr:MAG: Protein SrpB [Xylophilus sp.]